MNALTCDDARPLIPSWADGELSEAQAAPLRGHLLSCRACRGAMQDVRALRRWFVSDGVDAAALVPPGFAARVARRAFAGDTGEHGAPAPLAAQADGERGRLLQFVLQVTSVAAIALIALAVGLKLRDLPAGERLRADSPGLTYEQILERLDELDGGARDPAEPDADADRGAGAVPAAPQNLPDAGR